MNYEIKIEARMISGILQRGTFLLLLLLAGAFQALAQDPFYLVNQSHNDKVLQVSNSNLSNGSTIVLGERNDANVSLHTLQAWYYDNTTQTIRLKANPNKCIARKGQQMFNDPIVLADVVAGSDLQKWVVEGNRIKLVANKLLGIGIASMAYTTNTPVTLEEITTLQAPWEGWYMRQIPSQSLTADGNLHHINSPGETFLDMYIPDPCPYQYLNLRARGGDGGVRTVTGDVLKAKGGSGAIMGGLFKIGTGSGELKPGTNIRFVVGRAGESVKKNAQAVGACGGGATGVLAEVPGIRPETFNYDPWKLLLIAGGGGGAFSDCCAAHSDGLSANNGEAEIHRNVTHSTDTMNTGGWSAWHYGTPSDPDPTHGNGSGYKANSDPSNPFKGNIDNGDGAGFKDVGGMLFPVGGKNTNKNLSGGYGFGGGGAHANAQIWDIYPGGGGGYTGGFSMLASEFGGGGGGSYVNNYLTVPYSSIAIKNPVTADPANGYVEYQFTNNAPATRDLYFECHKGTEVQVLKSGDWTLLWQYDGNLVLYGPGFPNGAWASNTAGTDLIFQGDGNLVIYQANTGPWSTDTPDDHHNGKGGRKLVLTPEGSLFITDQDGKVIWTGR